MSEPADIVLTRAPGDAELIAAYSEMGSVWKVGDRFGIAGQTVHARLKRLGKITPIRVFTDAERARLVAEYEQHADAGTLDVLASDMGRTKPYIARHARSLGLTKQARKRPYICDKLSARVKKWHAENEHPRGFQGHSHSEDARRKVGESARRMWSSWSEDERAAATMKSLKSRVEKHGGVAPQRINASWKAGWREVGGKRCFFRSMWEANYARYLEWLRQRGEIQEWKHEPDVFWFEAIKRGVRSYKPDFRVVENSGEIRYHEVKGWMDDRSRTCLARMKRYHPSTIMILVDGKAYRRIADQVANLIPDWETGERRRGARKLRLAVPVAPL